MGGQEDRHRWDRSPRQSLPCSVLGFRIASMFFLHGENYSSGSVSRLDPNELTYSVCGLGQHTKNFLPWFLKLEQRVCRVSLLHCSLLRCSLGRSLSQAEQPGSHEPGGIQGTKGSLFCPWPGRSGLRGGGGPEGSSHVLVHSEIRQGEPPAAVPGAPAAVASATELALELALCSGHCLTGPVSSQETWFHQGRTWEFFVRTLSGAPESSCQSWVCPPHPGPQQATRLRHTWACEHCVDGNLGTFRLLPAVSPLLWEQQN